jgi:hypothetical protein
LDVGNDADNEESHTEAENIHHTKSMEAAQDIDASFDASDAFTEEDWRVVDQAVIDELGGKVLIWWSLVVHSIAHIDINNSTTLCSTGPSLEQLREAKKRTQKSAYHFSRLSVCHELSTIVHTKQHL